MRLYRFRVYPESAWRTPWQSDTLSGLLCWAMARTHGGEVLRRQFIEPALNGDPPFALSDAFPGDRLPLPAHVRLMDWPADRRKAVKKARWLEPAAFRRVQLGGRPAEADLIRDAGVHEYAQLRNTIGRSTGTTPDSGGLFPADEAVLGAGLTHLTVYARVRPGFETTLWELLGEVASGGFGSDRSAGKGQFRLSPSLEPAGDLDELPGADGTIGLSTFQPGPDDPTAGAWEAFTKYGKLGPDFGLDNVFKRPLIVLRPGASFGGGFRPLLGRAIPAGEMLAPDVAADLAGRGASVVHWAFGVGVPARLPEEVTA